MHRKSLAAVETVGVCLFVLGVFVLLGWALAAIAAGVILVAACEVRGG